MWEESGVIMEEDREQSNKRKRDEGGRKVRNVRDYLETEYILYKRAREIL